MKRIKDLKTRGLGTHRIQQQSSVEDAVREFLATGVSALVVYDGKKLAGIFTKNDLVRCVGDRPDGIRGITVGDYMKANVYTTRLQYIEEKATVILVSDGKETCHLDPCQLASELENAGADFTAHVIGFDITMEERAQLQCLAETTGGLFRTAVDAEGLKDALGTAVEKAAEVAPPRVQLVAVG